MRFVFLEFCLPEQIFASIHLGPTRFQDGLLALNSTVYGQVKSKNVRPNWLNGQVKHRNFWSW
ncbi:hypothetical protein Cflav_PD1824 [Pedosphaera parvula Ellin514]|uniref:Uncharacterized protein n=1 Tax=Pedosphaera parvula (strain Ellin514) TaxID=320771 RepID=B9XN66_PEDPL|nr:hypothetical protein Cflav_PD1824 [Pedosphaera parvula Ellin514]